MVPDVPQSASRGIPLASAPNFGGWLEVLQEECILLQVDAAELIEYVSPSVKRILGFSPGQLLGRPYHDYFDFNHPLHAQLLDLTDRLFGSDPPNVRRCVARRSGGGFGFLSIREQELHNDLGEAVGRQILALDVTGRVESELALRKSERKHRRLIEGIREEYIICAHDREGCITYISPSVKHVMGYNPRDVLGRNWRLFAQPDGKGRADAERVDADIALGKRVHKFLLELNHADGGKRILQIQQRAVFGLGDEYETVEGIARDVTESIRSARLIQELQSDLERRVLDRTKELQQANERLALSEAQFRNVVDTQSEFITRWLPDGTRTFVNDAYCRYFGRSAEELLGTSFVSLIYAEDQPVFRKAVASMSPDRPSISYETRVRRLDGSMGWIEWLDRAFFDSHGLPAFYQSVGRDVTELKAAGDLLRQKEAHLAHVSRLATMGEMVAGIAHEINQPLHAAKTFAEAARRHLKSGRTGSVAEAVECMNEISHAVVRTVEIIRRLRDFAKSRPVKLELLSLNDVAKAAVSLLDHEFRRSKVCVDVQLDPNLPLIRGDRIALEQFSVNLLKNACEAMEDASLQFRVATVRTSSANLQCRLEVQDAGAGLGEADEGRILHAFYSTKPDGMGMGLSLCQTIAEAHGGELCFATNREGPGMTFGASFPVASASPGEIPLDGEATSSRPQPR
jgi:PAS domain S-box-containing protein